MSGIAMQYLPILLFLTVGIVFAFIFVGLIILGVLFNYTKKLKSNKNEDDSY